MTARSGTPPQLPGAITAPRRRRSRPGRRNHWADTDPAIYTDYPRLEELGYLQQLDLIRRAQTGDAIARETVWLHNLRLVYSVANEFNIPEAIMPDVLQEGATGLAEAIERFDIQRFGELTTYAWHWIRQRMSRCLQRHRYRAPVPGHLYAAFARYCRQRRHVATRDDWYDWWIAGQETDAQEQRYLRRLAAMQYVEPLSAVRGSAADSLSQPDVAMEHCETLAELCRYIGALDPRGRAILAGRYGLGRCAQRTLQEIATDLGLSRERVRQLQQEAEEQLAILIDAPKGMRHRETVTED